MKILIIFLAISVLVNVIGLIKWWKEPSPYSDTNQVLYNRLVMNQIAREEYKKRGLSPSVFGYLSFVFHPDFRNIFDAVPMSRAAYVEQMKKTDTRFWKEYGIAPNFKIDHRAVYEAYKEYVIKGLETNPELFQDSQVKRNQKSENNH